MDSAFSESNNAIYGEYWAGVFTMDRENVLRTLLLDNLRNRSNKDLCKLFKFLSCFFCCLDRFDSDDDHKPGPKPESKPEPKPCGCTF
jgi:hypothetical protein